MSDDLRKKSAVYLLRMKRILESQLLLTDDPQALAKLTIEIAAIQKQRAENWRTSELRPPY